MRKVELTDMQKLPYAVEEALNRLRVNLAFCGTQYKSIIITSSTPDEGKSFISANLWRLLAEAGKRVVLVDADIRKSVLRSRYRMISDESEMLGIASLLSGQARIEDVIYSTNIENAYIIPVTDTVMNPALLLQGKEFGAMMDGLSKDFDYVIVDTPPLSNVSDGDLIASHCDGAILVVRSGETPKKLISSSMKQLERAGCDLMGVVLSRANLKKNAYYYKYSKYGYYSDYSKTKKG